MHRALLGNGLQFLQLRIGQTPLHAERSAQAVNALAFLRITTHPKIHELPLTSAQALDWLGAFLRSPAARWVHPADDHLLGLERVLVGSVVGNLVMDAHLAALALENGASVVTFDRDFLRFKGLRVELLG